MVTLSHYSCTDILHVSQWACRHHMHGNLFCVAFHTAHAGMLKLQEEEQDAAMELFRRVLRFNPRHKPAAEQLAKLT